MRELPYGNIPVFRQEDDWNVCGMELRDGKWFYCYWFQVGGVRELVDEREIELPPPEEFRRW